MENTTQINNMETHMNNFTEFNKVRFSLEWLIFLSILYSFTTLFSVIGNILVILVFVRGRHSKTDLRPFLINLAVADLIMAIFCMPFTFGDAVFRTWIFTAPMCPIVIFMQTLSVAASVFINVAIGIDRFIVVTFPLLSKGSKRRTKFTIIGIWIISLSVSLVVVPVAKVERVNTNILRCSEFWPDMLHKKIYTAVIFSMIYVVPLIILTISYSVVGFLLWKRTSPGNRDHVRDFLQLKSKIKVLKMLLLVVVMFGVCWLPLHVFNVIVNFRPELSTQSPEGNKILLVVYISTHWLAMANSFANPVIYSFTNDSFRIDLVMILKDAFPCCRCIRRLLPARRTSIQLSQRFLLQRGRRNNSTSSRSSRSLRMSVRDGNSEMRLNGREGNSEVRLIGKDGASEVRLTTRGHSEFSYGTNQKHCNYVDRLSHINGIGRSGSVQSNRESNKLVFQSRLRYVP